MRASVAALAVLLAFGSPARSQENRGRHPWLRRVTLAAACAASFWDVQTTHAGVAQGAREANPLFADPQGHPRWGRLIGFKAGACAASFVAEERFARSGLSDRFWVGVNSASAAGFSAIAIRNIQLTRQSAPSAAAR